VHVTIQPAIADTARYNFTFSKRKPVQDVMDMLCFIAPIHYRLQGNDILITQK
jgi:c-di-GMP-binding flagellar brake protein YcgR